MTANTAFLSMSPRSGVSASALELAIHVVLIALAAIQAARQAGRAARWAQQSAAQRAWRVLLNLSLGLQVAGACAIANQSTLQFPNQIENRLWSRARRS